MAFLAWIIVAAILFAAIVSCIPTTKVLDDEESQEDTQLSEREAQYHQSNQFGR